MGRPAASLPALEGAPVEGQTERCGHSRAASLHLSGLTKCHRFGWIPAQQVRLQLYRVSAQPASSTAESSSRRDGRSTLRNRFPAAESAAREGRGVKLLICGLWVVEL